MSNRSFRWWVIAALMFVVALSVSGISAQDGATPSSTAASVAREGIPAGAQADDAALVDTAVRREDGRLRVLVELDAVPAAVVFAQAGGDAAGVTAQNSANAQRQTVERQQTTFVSSLSAVGVDAEFINSTNTVLNSVSLWVLPQDLAALRAQPGVAAVYPVTRVERANSSSVPSIGAPSAWNGTFGSPFTGAGIIVSVIDDGLDFTHTGFGGDGNWPADPVLRQTVDGVTFPNSKVIGGYDYVGDFFNGGFPGASGLVPSIVETPDPNPNSCSINPADMQQTFGFIPGEAPVGHGTHVAGTVASFGVNADGTTYTGGYDSVPFETLLIGPGVAPEAQLIAMRVFGCFGSAFTDTIVNAIDDSVSGKYSNGVRADVINMSLGSGFGYGGDDPSIAPYIAATDNATLAGTLVVASAGNSRDTFYVTGAPSTTPSALSVASTSDGGENGFLIDGVLTAARFGIVNAPSSDIVDKPFIYLPGNGCQRAQYATFPADHFAVLNWTGACGSIGLMTAAKDAPLAGGNAPLGILVVNNVPSSFQNLTCSYGGTQLVTPPVTCMSLLKSTGQFLAANPGALLTQGPNFAAVATELSGTASVFTSRGPARHTDPLGGLKPNIAAPGDFIVSVGAGTGSGPQSLGGTSMAAPHVAGAAALAMQANPAWSAQQIKALLMNTANNDVFLGNSVTGPRISPSRAGTGIVDVEDAMQSQVIAYNRLRPAAVGVNFDYPQVVPGETGTFTRQVTVQNLGSTPATYNLEIDTYSDNRISAFTVSPSTVTVPAFGRVHVTVTLTITPDGAASQNYSDASMGQVIATQLGNFRRIYLSEEVALLKLIPAGGSATVPLRVQLYAAPRAVSRMASAANPLILTGFGAGFNFVPLSGVGVNETGTFPQAVISQVSAFEFVGADDVGDTLLPVPGTDIQYVGVASNFYNGGSTNGAFNNDSVIFFGVALADDYATLQELQITVYMDTDRDGNFFGPNDAFVFELAPPLAGTTARSDTYFTVAGLTVTGSGFYHDFINSVGGNLNTYAFDTNVVVLPFFPGLPLNYDFNGATPVTPLLTNTAFDFYVETFAPSLGEVIDTSPIFSYDVAAPVIDTHFEGVPSFLMPVWDDVDGNNVPFYYDFTNLDAQYFTTSRNLPALLLLHHHNADNHTGVNGQNFRRAEVVNIQADAVDIVLGKSVDPINVLPGDQATFALEAFNISGGTSAIVIITDELSPNVRFISASDGCLHSGDPIGGTVVCSDVIGPLGIVSFEVTVQVLPSFVGEIVNTAEALTSVIELDASDNVASATLTVRPFTPVPSAPVGSTPVSNPSFVFSNVLGGQSYQIVVETLAGDAVADVTLVGADICAGNTCTADLMLMLAAGEYKWYVTAIHPTGGPSTQSAELVFTVTAPPAIPVITAPLGDIIETNPAVTFNSVPGATWYFLWVQVSGPGGTVLHSQWHSAADVCSGATCSINAGLSLQPGTTYSAFAQAWSQFGGFSGWSAEAQFRNVSPLPAPTIITPVGNTTATMPTFEWGESTGATWYYIYVSFGGSQIFAQWYPADAICAGGTCGVTPGLNLTSGVYEWWVQGWSPVSGFSPWAGPAEFTVFRAPATPVTLAPTGAIAQTNPTFSFNHSPGATMYYLYVSNGMSVVTEGWYMQSNVCTGALCGINAGLNLANGNYFWFIRAYTDFGGFSPWSAAVPFTVNTSIQPALPASGDALPDLLPPGDILPPASLDGALPGTLDDAGTLPEGADRFN